MAGRRAADLPKERGARGDGYRRPAREPAAEERERQGAQPNGHAPSRLLLHADPPARRADRAERARAAHPAAQQRAEHKRRRAGVAAVPVGRSRPGAPGARRRQVHQCLLRADVSG